ncbi:MAG: ABC transporter ATP-binding protein [Cyclobacteriaceae bacterium]|nr:ABC transporter ATP-binding protein [Cyclobacteriaceae bacterium]
MQPILDIQHIGKRYNIAHQSGNYLSMRERISQLFTREKTTKEEFWALQDVSFSVMPGESIGIIGRNGAGKSTLLKILSKITPPTTGKIISRGRIASLLEVGTGFHTELSGRENIFFNGSLLGMKHAEIKNKFDEIVDFSGVEKFLDTPLKHYSSGMQLRLAFAVAAFLEPEILIIDEVLAVGDAEFQKKCMGKMEDVSKSGRTILFVSHNMAAVSSLCKKGIYLKNGKVIDAGPVHHILNLYQSQLSNSFTKDWLQAQKDNKIVFTRASLTLTGSQPCHTVEVSFSVLSKAKHNKSFIAIDIVNSIGITVLQAIPELNPFLEFESNEKDYKITISLPPLIPDHYRVSIWIGPHNTETYTWQKEILEFEISESPTPGRSFPHSHNNGFIVANSTITRF